MRPHTLASYLLRRFVRKVQVPTAPLDASRRQTPPSRDRRLHRELRVGGLQRLCPAAYVLHLNSPQPVARSLQQQSKIAASDAAVLSILNRGAVAEVVVGLVLFDNLGVFALFYECIGLRAASEGHVPEFVADLE